MEETSPERLLRSRSCGQNPTMKIDAKIDFFPVQKLCQHSIWEDSSQHVHVPKSSGFIVLSGQVIILRHDVGASSLRGLMLFQHLLVASSASSEYKYMYILHVRHVRIYLIWGYWNQVTSSEMMFMLENFDSLEVESPKKRVLGRSDTGCTSNMSPKWRHADLNFLMAAKPATSIRHTSWNYSIKKIRQNLFSPTYNRANVRPSRCFPLLRCHARCVPDVCGAKQASTGGIMSWDPSHHSLSQLKTHETQWSSRGFCWKPTPVLCVGIEIVNLAQQIYSKRLEMA